MGDSQTFPDDPKEFLMDYSFLDSKQYYTNGACLIPVFRVEQMMEHYFSEAGFNLEDYLADISGLMHEDPIRVDQRYWNVAIQNCIDLAKIHHTCHGSEEAESGEKSVVQYSDANKYQKDAMRTDDMLASERILKVLTSSGYPNPGGIIEGALGMCGEVGELHDVIKKWIFHERPLDEEHAKKELGDALWYAALLCSSFGWDLAEIMSINIEKLKKRYPDGFNVERANNKEAGDV